MEVVSEAVSLGEMEDIVQQLPADFEPLFAGSSGNIRKPGRQSRRDWALEEEAENMRGGRQEERPAVEQGRPRSRSQRQYEER